MPNRFSADEIRALPQILSAPRFATYLNGTGSVPKALSLYHWNAQVSSAFLFPLHVFEICVRNAAANAVESHYNPSWPWAPAFQRSLPDPPRAFSPRRDLQKISNQHATLGKVIAELKFAFWQSLYTSRHDGRLWNSHIFQEYPNFAAGTTVSDARDSIYNAIDLVRNLRNRIAHHEPVFGRDLVSDYKVVLGVIEKRCSHTSAWVNRSQSVFNFLAVKP